jgi:hypothetical protein
MNASSWKSWMHAWFAVLLMGTCPVLGCVDPGVAGSSDGRLGKVAQAAVSNPGLSTFELKDDSYFWFTFNDDPHIYIGTPSFPYAYFEADIDGNGIMSETDSDFHLSEPFTSVPCPAQNPVSPHHITVWVELQLGDDTLGEVDPDAGTIDLTTGSYALEARLRFTSGAFGPCNTEYFDIEASGCLGSSECQMGSGDKIFSIEAENIDTAVLGSTACGGCGADISAWFDLGTGNGRLFMLGRDHRGDRRRRRGRLSGSSLVEAAAPSALLRRGRIRRWARDQRGRPGACGRAGDGRGLRRERLRLGHGRLDGHHRSGGADRAELDAHGRHGGREQSGCHGDRRHPPGDADDGQPHGAAVRAQEIGGEGGALLGILQLGRCHQLGRRRELGRCRELGRDGRQRGAPHGGRRVVLAETRRLLHQGANRARAGHGRARRARLRRLGR